MTQPFDDETVLYKASLLVDELAQALSSDNVASGRRACTRVLNQWKKEISPSISQEESVALILNSVVAAGGGGDVAADVSAIKGSGGDTLFPEATISTLLSIIDNDDEFSTEGHREMSVEIIRGLIRSAFGAIDDIFDDDDKTITNNNNGNLIQTATNERSNSLVSTMIQLFHDCSFTFQKRMRRGTANHSNHGFHSSTKGTTLEPMESSEDIRLLLVDLMVDLGDCMVAAMKGEKTLGENNVLLIESTSITCQTLAKSALLDPYPDVQRASCSLIETLAQLCPSAIQMNSSSLLVPLTGQQQVVGATGEANTNVSSLSKQSLFRHRHAKTRCKAVYASVAIALCCARGNGEKHQQGSTLDGADKSDIVEASRHAIQTTLRLSTNERGGNSSFMRLLLEDVILPGWEDLIKLDQSASVRFAVLESLGKVARVLRWDYSPAKHDSMAALVETKTLALFLYGLSDGNAIQVQTAAIQQLSTCHRVENNTSTDVPWDVLADYFLPTIDTVLASCSNNWTTCKSKVRALEALKILVSLSIPLSETMVAPAEVELSEGMIQPIVEVLTAAILSEEKEVLDATLTDCRIIGSSNRCSELVLNILSKCLSEQNESSCTIVEMDVEDVSPGESQSTFKETTTLMFSSPRQMTAVALLLDGMMKGFLSNEEATLVIRGVDPNVQLHDPSWFASSHTPSSVVGTLFCHPTITNNVATHSSLAWALLDACFSFVKCVRQSSGSDWMLRDDIVVDVLVSIANLLGCPDEYGLSHHASIVLSELSSCCKGIDHGSSPMDVYFRQVLSRILSPAPPFPWKQSDPAFLATNALLRASKGSTIRDNFDLVATFFIYHLSTKKHLEEDSSGGKQGVEDVSNALLAKDELTEEYSLRISLMSLLQTILSDGSFTDNSSTIVASPFSTNFTTDVLLSLVLPNLVWRAGGLASALRKLSAATLFSLLSNHGKFSKTNGRSGSSGESPLMNQETLIHLIPILHSSLEDTESTTRELSCVCLFLILDQISTDTFNDILETETRIVETLYPRLLGLLDDSHNPVRMASCKTLSQFLTLAHSCIGSSKKECCLGMSSLNDITSTLMVQLDDPDAEIQHCVFQVLMVLLNLQYTNANDCLRQNGTEIVEMMKRHATMALNSHRDGHYCHLLLEKIQSCEHSKSLS